MNLARESILLVDDDILPVRAMGRELALHGWDVCIANSGDEALDAARARSHTAMVIDLQMPDMDGVTLIEHLAQRYRSAIFFLLSGQLDVAATVRAVRAGAQDVLEKPISAAALDRRLRALVTAEQRDAAWKAPAVRAVTASMSAIMGDSPTIRAVREQVRTVARYRDLPVLITGETGTGKELVAQAVHGSSESDGPFVPVNCAAIPEALFESELFGHEAGAFTGARSTHPGLFETAGGGTLFLDEIGELPSSLQPKLLRALETRSFRRVGGNRDLPFRARVISATHRTLHGRESSLRGDLYYRLAGFTIATPPLRDRVSDLNTLAQHFLSDFSTRYRVNLTFSPRALEALHAYDWPGNVRELRAVVQQAAVLCTGERVSVADLMAALRDRQAQPGGTLTDPPKSSLAPISHIHAPLRETERRTILETWDASGKNLSAAARALGLPRTTLRDRLRKYGLR